jgi:hypothetical protein
MVACNRLRIEPADGSPPIDYRIVDRGVETRILRASEGMVEAQGQWQLLTPEELNSRMTHTVVARWLRDRMGIYRLARVCNRHVSSANSGVEDSSGPVAA